MDFRIFTEPQQGASYDELLAVALRTEQLGFDGFFRSDHYLRMGDGDPGYGPTDAWTSLAGLARDTSRVRLGTLVSSVTYRLPGILAVQVANVDAMSGGRVELGLGTGWFAEEHAAYGIPFPKRRFDLLEEQLAIVTGMWATPAGTRFSFEGEHYTITDSPALPEPAQDRLPVIVGGLGEKRTPRLAAQFADEHNLSFPPFDRIRPLFAALDRAIEVEERTRPVVRSVALVACVGEDEATVARRAAAIGREPAELREHGIAGTRAEVEDRLGALADDGVERVYLQTLDLTDLDHLDELAAFTGTAVE
ncbi:probable F420-dependent oxidoreductase, Rv1855c family [Agrococcus baldri]|uniref:Probable F420-dependent oxidoreductase, Rv1855c family n=1 Tax=Agrococcus baldri TaxID=153730 RepID=A0AA94HP04_9MICO|nr:TIGR03560 family F420-dependent LLM class oxidoreductase [Agrococcus baldri]SFS16155.1 probable F420-dependent oxidoreductase, Rv1855c family [Agrococcus baldri]